MVEAVHDVIEHPNRRARISGFGDNPYRDIGVVRRCVVADYVSVEISRSRRAKNQDLLIPSVLGRRRDIVEVRRVGDVIVMAVETRYVSELYRVEVARLCSVESPPSGKSSAVE